MTIPSGRSPETGVGPLLAHDRHRRTQGFRLQHVGHDADLLFPDFRRNLFPDLLFQHVVDGEAQLGPGQWTGVGRIPEHDRLRRDLGALRVGRAQDDQQVAWAVGDRRRSRGM